MVKINVGTNLGNVVGLEIYDKTFDDLTYKHVYNAVVEHFENIGLFTSGTREHVPFYIQSWALTPIKQSESQSAAWVKITPETMPKSGQWLLLYNEDWENEDFNPNGVRIGFHDDLGLWISAYWSNDRDEFATRMSNADLNNEDLSVLAKLQVPTHYIELSHFNKPEHD